MSRYRDKSIEIPHIENLQWVYSILILHYLPLLDKETSDVAKMLKSEVETLVDALTFIVGKKAVTENLEDLQFRAKYLTNKVNEILPSKTLLSP